MVRLTEPTSLAAAAWALLALQQARRQLHGPGPYSLRITAPPPLPNSARRGAAAALRRRGATCLMEAAVLQRWDAAHDCPRDIVVGVTAPAEGFKAHAWLEGAPHCHAGEFQELLRLPAAPLG